MKLKWIPVIAVLVIGLALAGCGASTSASTPAGRTDSAQLTDAETLALGTLKLEETAQAVDAGQAAELLPLWKAAQSLGASSTITSQEMDALYAQIRGAMTPAQIEAIDAMNYSADDIAQMQSTLGVGLPAVAADSTDAPTQASAPAGAPVDGLGAAPDGGGIPAGGDLAGMAPPSGDTSGVGSSARQASSQPLNVNIFIAPLIELLKSKVAA